MDGYLQVLIVVLLQMKLQRNIHTLQQQRDKDGLPLIHIGGEPALGYHFLGIGIQKQTTGTAIPEIRPGVSQGSFGIGMHPLLLYGMKRRIVQAAHHVGGVPHCRTLQPPLAEGYIGTSLKIDNCRIPSGPQDLAQMKIVMHPDFVGREFIAGDSAQLLKHPSLQGANLLQLLSNLRCHTLPVQFIYSLPYPSHLTLEGLIQRPLIQLGKGLRCKLGAVGTGNLCMKVCSALAQGFGKGEHIRLYESLYPVGYIGPGKGPFPAQFEQALSYHLQPGIISEQILK